MFRLIRFALHHRVLVLVGTVLTAIAGFVAMRTAPVDALPDLAENQVLVLAEWHGRSPPDVERQVTWPLSASLQGIPDVRAVRGMSTLGMSMVYVVFADDVALPAARARVLERLQSGGVTWPAGVVPRLGPEATPLGQIFWYTLEGGAAHDLATLRSLQDWTVRPALQAVQGVAEVASAGGFEREIHVDVDPDRLEQHGLTVRDVVAAVSRAQSEMGGGTVAAGGVDLAVRGRGTLGSAADVEQIVVSGRAEAPLLLRHVATVQAGPAPRTGVLSDEHGERTGGVVTMRHGENPREVLGRVREAIARLSLPAGVRVVPFYDRAQLVDETMGTLRTALVEEILVALAVILLFLLNLRVSLIVATTLPLGVLMSFIGMRLLGIESNLMSLAGIAIAIGTMDDMGIVMSENIFAHLQARTDEARSRLDVILHAAREVAPAIATAVATMVVSFLPVFFLTGQAHDLFAPLAWTKTLCVVSSLLVALVLIPVLCHLWLPEQGRRPPPSWVRPLGMGAAVIGGLLIGWRLPGLGLMAHLQPLWPALLVAVLFAAAAHRLTVETLVPVEQNPVSQFIYRHYEPMLRRVLAHKRRFAAVAIALVALGLLHYGGLRLFLAPLHAVAALMGGSLERVEPFHTVERWLPPIDEAFMPPLDEGSLLFMPSLLPQASLEQTAEVMARLDRRIAAMPEVAQVMGKAGRAETALDPAPPGMIETVVNLRPSSQWRDGMTRERLVGELRAATALPGVSPSWLQPIEARVVMLQSDLRASMALRFAGVPLGPDGVPLDDAAAHAAVEALAVQLQAVVAGVEGAVDVSALRAGGRPYLEIAPDRLRAARFGANAADVLEATEIALAGRVVAEGIDGRARLPIRVRYASDLRGDLEAIGRLRVPVGVRPEAMATATMGHAFGAPDLVQAGAGSQVPLRWLADLRESVGPALIRTEDGRLAGYVMFNAGARGEEEVMRDALAAAARWRAASLRGTGRDPVPAGLGIEPAGRYLHKLEADRRLALIIPAVIAVNLLLLWLAFRRIGLALAIFAAIPIAFAGGFLAMWLYPHLTATDPIRLTTAVWVGFITLFGIAVDDGAVMGTYLVQRFAGRTFADVSEVRQAVVEAGLRRIRPCLMTTATTVIALLPVLWSDGRGADVMQPMAVPLLGGMLMSLVTLFTVPAVFSFIEERRLSAAIRARSTWR